MKLSAIVAIANNNAIGKNNQLPWHLPEDLKFFKRTTIGKPVLMGRKTFESLGKQLPGRLNIVISKQADLQLPDGVAHCTSIEDGIKQMQAENNEEGFIIGGGAIFTATLSIIESLYLTKVDTVVEQADAFFPNIDHTHWKMTWEEKHAADEKNKYNYTFQHYERIDL